MTLSVVNPNYVSAIHNSFDSIFENLWKAQVAEKQNRILTPRTEVFEEADVLVVEAEMPGVKKADVALTFENGVLLIQASKKVAERNVKTQYVSERSFGTYERRFKVSEAFDAESIQASFEDGILRVQLKRKPETAPRKIEVV